MDLSQYNQRITTNQRHTSEETERIRQTIAEDNVALSLATEIAEGETRKLPLLPLGGYAETTTLIRYNGAAHWSPADTGKIAKFFRSRFGYPLPVSAMVNPELTIEWASIIAKPST